jgi:hypothetical protein
MFQMFQQAQQASIYGGGGQMYGGAAQAMPPTAVQPFANSFDTGGMYGQAHDAMMSGAGRGGGRDMGRFHPYGR